MGQGVMYVAPNIKWKRFAYVCLSVPRCMASFVGLLPVLAAFHVSFCMFICEIEFGK